MSETKKSLTAIGSAQKTFTKAHTDLVKAMTQLSGMTESTFTLAHDIELAQDKLDAIAEDTKSAVRKSKAEIDMQILENESKVLDGLMKKAGLSHILVDDLSALEVELAAIKDSTEELIKAKVAQAVGAVSSKHTAELAQQEATHNVATATGEAELKSAQWQIQQLNVQVNDLKTMLTDEREARVKVAEAGRPSAAIVAAPTR